MSLINYDPPQSVYVLTISNLSPVATQLIGTLCLVPRVARLAGVLSLVTRLSWINCVGTRLQESCVFCIPTYLCQEYTNLCMMISRT